MVFLALHAYFHGVSGTLCSNVTNIIFFPCYYEYVNTQGFRSFVWTAVSYQLKDRLKLSPSASQFVSSIAFFPWSIKPLYGYGSFFTW